MRLKNPRSTALAAALAASALSTSIAYAQDAPTVQPTVAPPAPVAAPAPAAAPTPVFQPRSEVVQVVPPRPAPVTAATPEPAAAPVRRRAAATVARPAAVRAAAPQRAAVAAPIAATPAPSATDPVSDPVTDPAIAPPVADVPTPVPAFEPESVTTDTTAESSSFLWILAGLLGLGAIIAIFLARRRRKVGFGEAYVAEEAAAPAVDLSQRPWVRLSLAPISTERSGSERHVEYDLIVENEGQVPARDVIVSSFMTGSTTASVVATLGSAQSLSRTIDLGAGQSLSLRGTAIVKDGIEPKIVADAKYPLPDGTQGHLAARFALELSDDEGENASAHVEDVLERV